MIIDLDRKDLETLIKGSFIPYSQFGNSLVKKAGHNYSDQYGRTSWDNLNNLSDEELYDLYKIYKNS